MAKKKTKRTNASLRTLQASRFEVDTGLLIIIASVLVFIIGGYAVLFSAFLPLTNIPVRTISVQLRSFLITVQILDALATDTHYKYFVFLIIPMGTYFIIANWVGWQYYQNS